MRKPYIVYEQFYSATAGKVVKAKVADFYVEESARDYFNINKADYNLTLEKSVGNHVYTWNDAHEEWEA